MAVWVVFRFARDGVSCVSRADAMGATALADEAGDDPVEGESVVKSFVRQILEVFHGVRCSFGEKVNQNLAPVFQFDTAFDRHVKLSSLRNTFLILPYLFLGFKCLYTGATDGMVLQRA
jgi:hypothetical protein